MSHKPKSVHERLRETADHAWHLYCALEATVPHQRGTGFDPAKPSHQRLSAATAPGNSVAANLTRDFHREIRRLESHLKERLTGVYPKRRGSSSANTRYATDSVVKLCTTSDIGTVLGVLNYLTTWTRRADVLFNPENGLHRLPREPGEKETPCPYCKHKTMRWHPPRGQAVCIDPDCLNHDGNRPIWTVQYTFIDNQLTFRWDETEAA